MTPTLAIQIGFALANTPHQLIVAAMTYITFVAAMAYIGWSYK